MRQILLLLFFLFSFPFFAQEISVFDGETGKPIAEVLVYQKDTKISSVTDQNGKVQLIDFTDSKRVVFKHISYGEFSALKTTILANDGVVYLSKNSERLDEVVLKVFKDDAKLSRVAEQTAVVSSKDIQQISPQTSADLLANISGVNVQKSQSGGGSPVLRGMEANRVLLVVDGVRMNNAIYRKGHLQNSITVSPNLLERTEVVFGPSSVIYGSDALGGVIHYYTKTPKLSDENKVKSSFFGRYSSVNNELTTSVSAELSFKKWASFTSISIANFDDVTMGKNISHGFRNWAKVPTYSENSRNDFFETPTVNSNENLQRNTGFSQTDILQKFYVPLSAKTDLKVNLQYATSSDIDRFDKLTELKGESLKFAEWFYGPQKRLLVSSQLEMHPEKKWMEKGVLTLAYQNIQESRIQRKFGTLQRSYRNENVDVYSLNGDFSLVTAKNRNLGYGFELAYNDVSSSAFGEVLNVLDGKVNGFSDTFTVQSRYPDGGSTYFSSALYVDYRQDLDEKSTLNTGARLTHTNLTASWLDQTFIRLPQTDIQLQNTALTATAGYVFKPNNYWQLSAVLSSGFRSPNIDDVGKVREKNGKVSVPNVNLAPEKAYNAEIGVYRFINDRKFKLGANVYYSLLEDYIYREAFSLNNTTEILYDNELATIVSNVNKGNAYVTGFTASYQGKLSKYFKSQGAITYTKGMAYDSGEPLSSIPPLFGNVELVFAKDAYQIGSNFRFNAQKAIDNYNLSEGIDNIEQTPVINEEAQTDKEKYFGTPSWMTLNVFGSYKMNKHFVLQARVDNIFDTHYKEFASGVSAPGVNFSFSMQANF